MEAIGKTWEKSLTVEEDALKSGDGGTDEFLSREKDGSDAEAVKGEEYADVLIR